METVQWVQKPNSGGRLDRVMVSRSRDGGANWSEPQMPHPEHAGLSSARVMLWSEGDHGLGIAWSDGREGPTSLRTIWLDANVQSGPETVLDARFDACGSPHVALTARGPLLVWRDHVNVLRALHRNGQDWREPIQIHTAAGRFDCFVGDGPVIAAHAQTAVVAWSVHEGDDSSVIHMALSTDAGESFKSPVEIDKGTVFPFAVAVDARQAWVLWARIDVKGTQTLWMSRRSLDLQDEYERREIVSSPETVFSMSSLGIPQFVLHQGIGYLVWLEPGSQGSLLRAVKISAQ